MPRHSERIKEKPDREMTRRDFVKEMLFLLLLLILILMAAAMFSKSTSNVSSQVFT